MATSGFNTIDEYISGFPAGVQAKLQEIRGIIQQELPAEVTEAINYQMPTFKLNGNLVHFAAYEHHIGFYPAPSGVASFVEEFEKLGLKWSKGAVQFPIDKPLPKDLISRIVKFRLAENLQKKKK